MAHVYNQCRKMQTERIAELLAPFLAADAAAEQQVPHRAFDPIRNDNDLSSSVLENISTYIDLLLRWNARVNLTAVRDPEEIVTRHFGESLMAARHLFPKHVGTAAPGCPAEQSSAAPALALNPPSGETPSAPVSLADVGSGAGFPGIPIKLWAPQIALTLIESNHKKAAFLREVCRALTLTDINVMSERAETITTSFDVVTLRAVERFETVLPAAARLVKPTGRLALLIGSAQVDAARLALPEFYFSEPPAVPLSKSRILAIASPRQLT